MSVHTLQLMIILMVLPLTGNNMNRPNKEKQYYYCEYCGKKFSDVRQLTSATCPRHPCKYCGKKFPSIMVMTGGQCVNHPKGANKGAHAPAL